MSRRPRIGVFGGTFDPPHVGHLVVARDAAEGLGLERVLLVVAARPPHKEEDAPSPPAVRWRMVEAAVEGDPVLEASDLELGREGPSYTVDTLEEIRSRSPEVEPVLLLGADQFAELPTWHRPHDVVRLARLAVMAREGLEPGVSPGLEAPWAVVPVTRLDVSSTDVRRRVADERSVRDLVPPAVAEIIREEGLYRRPAAEPAEASA